MPKNYHLTYSFTEYNWPNCEVVLKAGGNVAIAFRIKPTDDKPLKFAGWKCIDGDESDVRYTDAPSTIVALSAKGRSGKMVDTMIVTPDDPRITWPKSSPYAKLKSDTELQKQYKSGAEKENQDDLDHRLILNRWYKAANAVIAMVNSDKNLRNKLFGEILKGIDGKSRVPNRAEVYKSMRPGLKQALNQVTGQLDAGTQQTISTTKPNDDILDLMASRIFRG